MSLRLAAIALASVACALVAITWFVAAEAPASADRTLAGERADIGESSELATTPNEHRVPRTARGAQPNGIAAEETPPSVPLVELARTTAGVLVRVVDRAGAPLEGVMVGFRVTHDQDVADYERVWLARAERVLDAALPSSANGSEAPFRPVPGARAVFVRELGGWTPPMPSDTTEPPAYFAVKRSDVRGEVLFAREPTSVEERWFVQPAMPSVPRDDCEVLSGAAPARTVELVLDGLRRLEIATSPDEGFAAEPWHVWIYSEQPSASEGTPTWRKWDALRSFAAGAVLELGAESTARVMVEFWQELPFFPRLRRIIEPSASAVESRRFVLDARDHLARVRVRLQHADGRCLADDPYAVTLWDGERELGRDLWTRESGLLELYVDARIALGPSAHLSFAMLGKRSIVQTERDDDEIHVPLPEQLSAGATYDFGVLTLGTGPLLYSGEVVDEEGKAIAHAIIRCSEGCDSVSDELGRFLRRGVARGAELMLTPQVPGYCAGFRSIAPGSVDVRLVLRRAAKCRGRILIGNLEDLHLEARFVYAGAEGTYERSYRLAAGAFEIEDLPPGRVRLEISCDKSLLRSMETRLSAGENDVGEIDLRAHLELVEIQVIRSDGSPATGERIYFMAFAEGNVALVERDAVLGDSGCITWWVTPEAQRWSARVGGELVRGVRGEPAKRVLRLPE